jgi:hypothetical protein
MVRGMRKSEMSFRQKVEALSKEQREEFEERAAIIEFDGKRDRVTAEYLAYLEIKERESRNERSN